MSSDTAQNAVRPQSGRDRVIWTWFPVALLLVSAGIVIVNRPEKNK